MNVNKKGIMQRRGEIRIVCTITSQDNPHESEIDVGSSRDLVIRPGLNSDIRRNLLVQVTFYYLHSSWWGWIGPAVLHLEECNAELHCSNTCCMQRGPVPWRAQAPVFAANFAAQKLILQGAADARKLPAVAPHPAIGPRLPHTDFLLLAHKLPAQDH